MEKSTEIFIVEDSLTQAEQLRYILEKNNYSVIHAIDAEKALEKLEQKVPDLIVSDVVMPGIDGYEFCKKVKSNPRFKKIPFILLTSLSDPNNILKGLEYGTDSFITKPYKEEFLLSKIQYLITNFKHRKKHPGEIVGLSIFDVFKEYPGMLTEVRKALKGKEVRSIDIVNGVYFDTLYQPVKDKEGDVVSVVGVAVDVTQQKLSEEKIKEKTKQLEKSNKEKEELITTKNKLMSIISHDLLGTLSSLLGFSDLLAHEIKNLSKEDIISIATTMNDAFNKQYQLLKDLLEWGHMQEGSVRFNPVKLMLISCINDTLGLLAQNLVNKNVSFETEIENELEIYADKHMLETIIRNLVSNAVKFSNTGGKIKATAKQKHEFIQINITDYGVGVEKDNLEKMFSKNEYLSTTGTNNEKGSGLGLILSREFVEKHGGKIWADSEIGNFTTISFTLPKNSAE